MPWTDALTGTLALARRHLGKGLLLLAAFLLAVLAGPGIVFGPKVPVELVVQRDFVQSVVASGRVETPHRVDLGAQITGTVLRVPVTEGQSVTAGTPLIELESTELAATLSQTELAVKQAQANHEAARQALVRNRNLFAKGFISQSALDEAKRAEQVDMAILSQAQAGIAAARARQRYATVSAPVSGTLIARNVEPGDVVQPGKVLMVLSPLLLSGETQLVVQIDEKNLSLLRLGLPALASADAYAQQRFSAELVFINPGVDVQRGSVEVKLRVASPPAYLKQDMTVSVDIEVARHANAILVPGDALHDANSASPWVLKVDNGKAHRQPVKLGLRSNNLYEVLEGLRAGDKVVPVVAATVTNGARIRAITKVTAQ